MRRTQDELESVAPLAGARIEILIKRRSINSYKVAPLAGARIEMVNTTAAGAVDGSLPSRERGLKSVYERFSRTLLCRSPRGSAD